MERVTNKLMTDWLDAVNLAQLPKNIHWIDNQIKKGRINKKWHNFLLFTMESLQVIYPDKWDIQFNIYNHFTTEIKENYAGYDYVITYNQRQYIFDIIVKFPDITITNSVNFKHNIKDLYVKIQFVYCEEIDNFVPFAIGGTRGKVTDIEAYSSYMHSHLQFLVGNFYPFCIGDRESEFGALMMECADNLTRENFQALFYMLETLVGWESLEGVPFYKIGNLNSNETTLPVILESDNKSYAEKLFEYRQENRMDINWKYENEVKINDDETFEEYIKFSSDIREYVQSYIVGRLTNGDYVNLSKRKKLPTQTQLDRTFIYNGDNIKLEIVTTTESFVNNFFVHPNIKKYIKTHLENEANNHIKRSNREKRISKFGYPE